MADHLTITFRGKGNNSIRVEDLVEQLQAFRIALKDADRLISPEREVHYRVAEIVRTNPYKIRFEPEVIEDGGAPPYAGVHKFTAALTAVQFEERVPEGYAGLELEHLKAISDSKRETEDMVIQSNGIPIDVEESMSAKINHLVGPDIFSVGSEYGNIERINIHRGTNRFWLYSMFPNRSLECSFGQALRELAIDAVGYYVCVYGQKRSKRVDQHPFAMNIERIEKLKPSKEKPIMQSFYGIAPGISGDLDSDEFTKEIRSGWH